MYELNNVQRKYLGLEPIDNHWDRVEFNKKCILYFQENSITRVIITDKKKYCEIQCNALTEHREYLLPLTSKGKAKKLIFSVIEKIPSVGVSFCWDSTNNNYDLQIINNTSKKEYYSSFMEKIEINNFSELVNWIDEYIKDSPDTYLSDLEQFKLDKRKHVKYQEGDFFAFKINRFEYGFGRILMDIKSFVKKHELPEKHELKQVMFSSLVVKVYHYISKDLNVDLDFLKSCNSLPSNYVIDNYIFYGDHKIIGHLKLEGHELDFPMSYSPDWNRDPITVHFQWGLLYQTKPYVQFNRYTIYDKQFIEKFQRENELTSSVMHSLFSNKGVSTSLWFSTSVLLQCISSGSNDPYWSRGYVSDLFDLRNPKCDEIRKDIFHEFNLDLKKDYFENLKMVSNGSGVWHNVE